MCVFRTSCHDHQQIANVTDTGNILFFILFELKLSFSADPNQSLSESANRMKYGSWLSDFLYRVWKEMNFRIRCAHGNHTLNGSGISGKGGGIFSLNVSILHHFFWNYTDFFSFHILHSGVLITSAVA